MKNWKNLFIRLLNFGTHVDSWNNPCITSDTIQILSNGKDIHTTKIAYYNKIRKQVFLILSDKS